MARNKGFKKAGAAKKPPLTHFLCLPLATDASRPQLEQSLKDFRTSVSPNSLGNTATDSKEEADATLPNIHPKAFRPVGGIHCTLGVMSLSQARLSEAVDFLKSLDITSLLENVSAGGKTAELPGTEIDSRVVALSPERADLSPSRRAASAPLSIELKGIVSMHAPTSTSILYCSPMDATGRLYPFCLAVQKLFKDKGLLVDDDRPLKLHATIVNTIYAKGKGKNRARNMGTSSQTFLAQKSQTSLSDNPIGKAQGHGPDADAPLKFDATTLLARYENYVWARNVILEQLTICEMGAKKITDEKGDVIDERYTEVASSGLPV